MAAPATSRWERAVVQGSAFSGLSRGRGYRGRGGHRGGRGGSRATPPAREQTTTEDNSPPFQAPRTPTRSSNRPKRSQVSKTSTGPKISPTGSTDCQPASALTKDPPPHLDDRVDLRHNIDALVERVRAVAMDNRPTTPGNHIDWAGDDDDTLPDLDDWGVNTTKFASGEVETISPIILEGLKPLPDVPAPTTASPLRQVATVNDPPSNTKVNVVKHITPSFVCGVSTPTPSNPDEDHVSVSNTPKNLDNIPVKVESPEQPMPPKHVYPSNRKPWHPSLPAKPRTGSLVPPASLRPVATPMRHPFYPKSITIEKECPLKKETQSAPEKVAAEITRSLSVEVVSAMVKLADERAFETSYIEADTGTTESAARAEPTNPAHQKHIFDDDDTKTEGLEASIHAPKNPAPAESITPHLITTPRNHWPYKKSANNHNPPLDQFNHRWNERSGYQSGLSPRNQSPSTVAGSPNSYHRIPATRPIITGDAMSRLARTIGQTNSAS